MAGKNCGKIGLADIGAALGISKAAVSLALADSPKISPATKRRVIETARKMGYERNPLLSSVMSGLGAGKPKSFYETIVLINANKDRDAPAHFPIFSKYIAGIRAEAKSVGYAVYDVWLHDRLLTPAKLDGILKSRGIRGGVIVGHIDDNILPERFLQIWRNYKFVSAGLKTFNPILDFISADKFLIAHYATKRIIERGFRRPLLVVSSHIDDIVEGRFAGGFLRAQLELPEADRIPPFMDTAGADADARLFKNYLARKNPDVIFSISNSTSAWLDSHAADIPAGVEVVHLERKSSKRRWIGLDKNYEMVGRIAVGKLFQILNAPPYMGGSGVHTATIVLPEWSQ